MAGDLIVNSPSSDVIIPTHQSLYQFICQDFDRYGNKPAITHANTGQTMSYADLKLQIQRCGSALLRRGFKKNDVVAIYSPNNPHYAVALLAVTAIGGIVTTINPLFTADELARQIKLSSAKYLIAYPTNADKALQVRSKMPLNGLFIFGDVQGLTPFSELLKDNGAYFKMNNSIKPTQDTVIIPYSSGTTGVPKGVMLTHYNLIANSLQLMHPDIQPFDNDKAALALLPWYHIYGLVVILLSGLRIGAHLISMERFQPEVFLESIQKYQIKYACLVPPLYVFLAKDPLVEKYDLSSLEETICGAAPLDSDLSLAVKNRAKISLLRQAYGMTELSPISHMVRRSDGEKYGAIGVCAPNTKAKIVDPNSGKSLPKGQEGELCIRGPQVMKGYFQNEKATAMTIDKDGWLHTGDIGYYDEDGYFYIVDRLKELIKYKGSQVAPAELEALLLTNEKIADAAVLGRPDVEAGELPMAFIVAKTKISEKEVMDYVKTRVSPHKCLRGGVIFVDSIPKSASGKILRRELRVQLKKLMQLQSKL